MGGFVNRLMLLYNAHMDTKLSTKISLEQINLDFSVCKIADIKDVDFSRPFMFLSKTDQELSLVCETDYVPSTATDREDDWKAFRVAGTLDFGMIGVISKLTSKLAEEGISVFVVSTYNTDYILVKSYNYKKALHILGGARYE